MPAGKRTFTCPACHAKFAWRDSYINRRVTCKCGRVFEAFEDSPADTTVPAYDVADDDDADRPVAPASTVSAPLASARSPLAAYPVRAHAAAQDEGGIDDSGPFRNLTLPLILLATGAAVLVLQAILWPREGESIAFTLAFDAMLLGLMVVIMVAGAGVAAALMGVEFGSIGRCILKFSATAVFAGSLAMTAAGLDPDPTALRGKIVALHLLVILYWVCLQLLFDLDLQENLMTVAIITVMQSATACVLWNL